MSNSYSLIWGIRTIQLEWPSAPNREFDRTPTIALKPLGIPHDETSKCWQPQVTNSLKSSCLSLISIIYIYHILLYMQIIRKNVPRNASLFCLLMFSLFHQTKPGLDCSQFDILSSVVSKFSPVPKSDPYRPIQRSWNFDDQLLKEVVVFTKLMYRIGVRIRFSNSPKKRTLQWKLQWTCYKTTRLD
jgi:hypothetical protein